MMKHAQQLTFVAEDEDNAKILRDLFEGTGIMSAIDHSKIESANDPETRAIDYEASRIARQAAEALRQSRRVRAALWFCLLSAQPFPSMQVNGLLPSTWLHAALVAVYLLCAVTLPEHLLGML
jgi:hypothetical protein